MLFEFIACLVRISFARANPKFGQYDSKGKPIMLPGCLDTLLTEVVVPNAKQDLSSLFRETIAADAELQAVLATSPISPYISPTSPLHLPYISPTSPLYLAGAQLRPGGGWLHAATRAGWVRVRLGLGLG